MDVMLPRYLRRGVPQQGLHRAEGSTRSIEQTCRSMTQPVPIEAFQSEP